jgi:hypothetical protein
LLHEEALFTILIFYPFRDVNSSGPYSRKRALKEDSPTLFIKISSGGSINWFTAGKYQKKSFAPSES